MNFEQAKNTNGSVIFDGVEYAMTNAAQADNYGTEGAVRYYAHAINKNGDEYRVAFETTAAWDAANDVAQCEFRGETPDMEEIAEKHGVQVEEFENIDLNSEEYACDWDSPASVTPL